MTQVGRVDEAALGGAAEEVVRVVGDELVERRGREHQRGDGWLIAPADAAHLLEGRGDGAGVAGQDGRFEPADVDAKLQGVRRHDAAHRAVADAALDGPALAGEVAAAITPDRVGVEVALLRAASLR